MGWLSAIGKVAGLVPLPGMNMLGKALDMAGGVGDVMGKQQGAAAQGRVQEANTQQVQDRNAINLYDSQNRAQTDAANTDLERKKFTTSDAKANFQQAILAELLQNGGGGVSMPGIPQMSGGIMEALKGPGAQAAMAALGSRAHAAQEAPPAFVGGEMLKAPSLTALPEQSGGSKLLDTIARIGQISGAAAPFMPPKKKPPMSEVPDGL